MDLSDGEGEAAEDAMGKKGEDGRRKVIKLVMMVAMMKMMTIRVMMMMTTIRVMMMTTTVRVMMMMICAE